MVDRFSLDAKADLIVGLAGLNDIKTSTWSTFAEGGPGETSVPGGVPAGVGGVEVRVLLPAPQSRYSVYALSLGICLRSPFVFLFLVFPVPGLRYLSFVNMIVVNLLS